MRYNRFLLLAPEVAERRRSAEAQKKFEEARLPALNKMKYYLQVARTCQHDLEKKGFWQAIPERRKEFLQAAQLLEKSADALAIALQVNRSQMNQDRLGSIFWRRHRSRTETSLLPGCEYRVPRPAFEFIRTLEYNLWIHPSQTE
jgi:hypothetical protein